MHRSAVGKFLRQLWKDRAKTCVGRTKATKDEKRAMLVRAHALANQAIAQDQDTWKARGKAGTVSHRLGRPAFGNHLPQRCIKPVGAPVLTEPVEEAVGVGGGTTLAVVRREMTNDQREQAAANHAATLKRKREEVARKVGIVREWTAGRTVSLASEIPALQGATPWPVGLLAGRVIDVVQLACPNLELTSKALAGFTDRTRDDDGDIPPFARQDILEAWRRRCEGIQTAQCKPCVVPPVKIKICTLAERCLCDHAEGRNTMRFVSGLTHCLLARADGILKKGTPGRALYDNGRAVIRVVRKGKALRLREKDVWVHLSYSNFNISLFHGLQLVGCDLTIYGESVASISLQWDDELPRTFWDIFYAVNVTKNGDY